MSQKLAVSPRYRKSAKRLFLREKSLRSRNPSFNSVSAVIASESRRGSEYAKQLQEKQKVRRLYGVAETQFKRYYQNAVRSTQNTAERMLQLLEVRLDNVVYRSGFAGTRSQARQLVSHRFFTVNGKVANIPSFSVNVNDKIKLAKKNNMFVELPHDAVPDWLEFDKKTGTVSVKTLPTREHVDADINEQLIVEYYSR